MLQQPDNSSLKDLVEPEKLLAHLPSDDELKEAGVVINIWVMLNSLTDLRWSTEKSWSLIAGLSQANILSDHSRTQDADWRPAKNIHADR